MYWCCVTDPAYDAATECVPSAACLRALRRNPRSFSIAPQANNIQEVNEAADPLLTPDANITFGTVVDESLHRFVIATGRL